MAGGGWVTPCSLKRASHQRIVASPVTRSAVRMMEWVPRRSRGTGHSKKVMSEPGLATPSP